MPEIISKYPEVTLKVLKDAGARCGEGLEQKILTKCPQDRFCSLPSGEVCVLGVNELSKAQQVTVQSLLLQPTLLVPLVVMALVIFTIGLFSGRRLERNRGG